MSSVLSVPLRQSISQNWGWHFLGWSRSQKSPVIHLSLPCLDLGLQTCARCPACYLGVGMGIFILTVAQQVFLMAETSLQRHSAFFN